MAVPGGAQPAATGQIPQGGGAQPQGANPLQPTYAPNAPQGQATLSNINLSPQSQIAQILKGFAPVQRQATSALNNNLAASGIVGGGGQGAQQLLQGQLSASIAPTLANAIQTAKSQQLQQGLGNAGLATGMTTTNLGNLMQGNEFNANAANSAGSQLAQLLQSAWGTQAGGLAGILGQGLSGSSGLAGQEAQNFDVPGNSNIWAMLGL
jgi:hypothetical protein